VSSVASQKNHPFPSDLPPRAFPTEATESAYIGRLIFFTYTLFLFLVLLEILVELN